MNDRLKPILLRAVAFQWQWAMVDGFAMIVTALMATDQRPNAWWLAWGAAVVSTSYLINRWAKRRGTADTMANKARARLDKATNANAALWAYVCSSSDVTLVASVAVLGAHDRAPIAWYVATFAYLAFTRLALFATISNLPERFPA